MLRYLKHPATCFMNAAVMSSLLQMITSICTSKCQCCNVSAAGVQRYRCHLVSLTHGYFTKVLNLSDSRKADPDTAKT